MKAKLQFLKLTGLLLCLSLPCLAQTGSWTKLNSSDGSNPSARHECSYVQAGNKFYLLGGRGIKPVQAYDPIAKKWTSGVNVPVLMHHFQAIEYKGLIYVIGAFTGNYPHETPLPNMYIYDPVANKWTTGPEIPAGRRRGSCGVVVYNDKIYLISGLTDGHASGHVTWFDEYDPARNAWKVMPNAPRPRDHFHAAMYGSRIYVAGGRRSSYPNTFGLTVAEIDMFDFTTGQWTTLPASANLPTKRAGAATVVIGNELVLIGGESSSQTSAHRQAESLSLSALSWRNFALLQQGRHGSQAIINNAGIYIAAGCANRGGSPELNTQEVFFMGAATQPLVSTITKSSLSGPSSLAFGQVAVNTTSAKYITLSNTNGNQGLLITGATVSGTAEFTVTMPYKLPLLLPPGKSLSVKIDFKPASTGSKTATANFNHTGNGGLLKVNLTGGTGTSTPPAGNSFKINAGGPQVTASTGTFIADKYMVGGSTYKNSSVTAINGTDDDALYLTERTATTNNGSFGYAIPLGNGSYRVVLHFAEIYFGSPSKPSEGTAGKRVFDVLAEGITVLDNYDINKKAGPLTAVTETLTVQVSDGILNLDFTSAASLGGVNRPKVSAIEVSPAASAPAGEQAVTALTGPAGMSEPQFKVYPNPVTGNEFTIEAAGLCEGTEVLITLYDIGGNRVLNTMEHTRGQQRWQRRVTLPAGSPKGVYYLKLACGKEIYMKKLILE